MKYVPGTGNPNARLMVIAEAPGEDEERIGEPLVGATGRLTQQMVLENTGIHWSEVYRTNVCKVRPPDNKLGRLKEIGVTVEEFLPQLENEIKEINPNCILALGTLALYHLTGKSPMLKWRGSILSKQGTVYPKVVATYHPANFLRSKESNIYETTLPYSALAYTKLDIARAGRESTNREFNLPRRTLQIARGASDLYNFFSLYRKNKRAAIDIEVVKSIPVCMSIAFVPHHSISIPLLNVGKSNISHVELAEMWRMVAIFLYDDTIEKVLQNGKFDIRRLEGPCKFKVRNFYADIMQMMHTLYPEFPKTLAFQTSIFTEEPYYKDELAEYNEKKGSFDDLMLYNAKDSAVTIEIFDKLDAELTETGLAEYYYGHKHKLNDLYIAIEREGFCRDEELYREQYIKYSRLLADDMLTLFDIVGPVNVNSPLQIRKLLFDKLKLPKRESVGEDDLVALQANHAADPIRYKVIDKILSIRRLSKTISTYLEADLDYDGKLKTIFNICGTETGRSSTQKVKPPNAPENNGLAFQTITKHGDVGSDIGKYMIPEPGYIFLNVDQKQAEARVVALLSKDYEMLTRYDTIDVHKWTAEFVLGIMQSKLTEGERYVGKTCRHMGHLGAGKNRFMVELNNGAKRFHINIPQISEWKAGTILDKFHKLSPKVRGVFHAEVGEALERDDYTITCPTGWKRTFYSRPGYEMLKEALALIPQNSIEYITKRAALLIRAERPDARIILESHDALLFMIRPAELLEWKQLITEKFELPLDFSRCSLPREPISIPCELTVGENYKELRRVA